MDDYESVNLEGYTIVCRLKKTCYNFEALSVVETIDMTALTIITQAPLTFVATTRSVSSGYLGTVAY